jgi:hypothetical protein
MRPRAPGAPGGRVVRPGGRGNKNAVRRHILELSFVLLSGPSVLRGSRVRRRRSNGVPREESSRGRAAARGADSGCGRDRSVGAGGVAAGTTDGRSMTVAVPAAAGVGGDFDAVRRLCDRGRSAAARQAASADRQRPHAPGLLPEQHRAVVRAADRAGRSCSLRITGPLAPRSRRCRADGPLPSRRGTATEGRRT